MTYSVTRDEAKRLALYVLRTGAEIGAFLPKRELDERNRLVIAKCLFDLYSDDRQGMTAEFKKLAESAKVSADDCRVALLVCAEFIDRGQPIPKPLREWFSSHILDGHSAPGKRGAPGKRTAQADALIHLAVQSIVDVGHAKATRHSYNPPTSACDIVADALSEIGHSIKNFDDVKKIYERLDNDLTDTEKRFPIWTPKPVKRWREGKSMFCADPWAEIEAMFEEMEARKAVGE